MAAKFHALTEADYQSIGRVVKGNTKLDTFDSLYDLYGYGQGAIIKSRASQNVRSVIKLSMPTFNYVLGGAHGSQLRKLLNVRNKEWLKIVNGEVIYDTESKEYVSPDEAEIGGRYLYGAEIAAMLIEKLDVEQALKDCIYGAIGSCLSLSVNPYDIVDVHRGGDGVNIAADFNVTYDDAVLKASYKRGHDPACFVQEVQEVLFSSDMNRFTLLYNMNPNKHGLYGMLNYYIVVVPEEMRPRIDMGNNGQGEHKLTARYTNILKANFELQACRSAAESPRDVIIKYNSLNTATSRLQYSNVGLGRSDVKPDDLSILERVKTKQGQIRRNNFGKRQDYSGRAVVVINPFLPVDYIRVPKTMIPKLFEYHLLPYLAKNMDANSKDRQHNFEHVRSIYDKLHLTNLDDNEARAEMLKIIEEERLLDRIPVYMGRQPTLHKQSLQGFHVEVSDLNAIEVSPLVCPAYNMDFDGDQAHIEVPLGKETIREVNDLMMTTQNIFLGKTGECTIEPRQDMLYGLFICTRSHYKVGSDVYRDSSFANYEEVRQAVMNNKVKVWQTVNVVDGISPVLAGDAAFCACFAKDDVRPRDAADDGVHMIVKEVTNKTITPYVDYILRTDTQDNFVYPLGTGYDRPGTFVGTINYLVELGFRVAKLYSPSMSLLRDHVVEDAANDPEKICERAIDKFHDDMKEADFYYGMGLETSDNYQLEFDKHLKDLDDVATGNIFDMIGSESGFALLSRSGARGSKSNLTQAFAYKGRVKKNSSESFNALLENSYSSMLTPLEHNVDAYGGRQGQIDKSLKTGDTGYAMRKMWHTTQGASIVAEDCGATEGLKISKAFIASIVDTPDISGEEGNQQIEKEATEIFVHALVGRYRVGSNKMITKKEAEELAKSDAEVEIRSPLYCRMPFCAKCYGRDPSSHKKALVGLPIGVLAAHAIGEPGSQLTLKQFQKGGVSGKAEFTSAFDKVDAYIHIRDLAAMSAKGSYAGYDPVAWASGPIKEEPTSEPGMKKIKIGESKKSIVIPQAVILKDTAIQGQGISYKHGDYSIQEIVNYGSLEHAQRYLAFKLFYLYKNEVKIVMCHFETLVACMTRYMITSTDRRDLMVGQYATREVLYKGSLAKTKFIPRLVSVKGMPRASTEALDTIIMEEQAEGLSKVCLLEMEDTLTRPLNRMLLGKTILTGSATPGYVENRKEKIS